MPNPRLENKVIVVTGGANGVGKGVVLEGVNQGATVIIGDKDKSSARQILKSISGPGKCDFIQTDLANVDSCENLFEEVFGTYSRIDGFFNYAGVTPAAELLDCDQDHFDLVFDVNTRGALFCCKQAVKYMIKSGGGSIVLTGSPHAWGGDKDRIAYACSKGAIITMTNNIAEHYAKEGIRANYVTMGWTPTEGELSLRKSQGMSECELRSWAAGIIPAGRMTEVEDLVPGVIYLLSDESKMVSGSNFRMTGGWFL
jgi:NAD(P)-dependent dehydrogenase (short-subunit alcohol dehydrogenase family)